MTYTCLTVSQVSPARGMTMVMSARKELTWRKKKPVVYPLQTKTWSECYHVNGGDPAEETPPSRRTTVNKRGHVDDVQNHQQRRDNGTGIANNRSVSAQCCQSSEMNEKRNKEFTFGVFVYLPDVVGRWGSRRWCWTEESNYSPSWPGTALHMRPLTQKRCHQMIQKEGRSDSTSMTLDVFFLRCRGFFHSDWLIPSVVSHLS